MQYPLWAFPAAGIRETNLSCRPNSMFIFYAILAFLQGSQMRSNHAKSGNVDIIKLPDELEVGADPPQLLVVTDEPDGVAAGKGEGEITAGKPVQQAVEELGEVFLFF